MALSAMTGNADKKRTPNFGPNGIVSSIEEKKMRDLQEKLNLAGLKYIDDSLEENNNSGRVVETDVDGGE